MTSINISSRTNADYALGADDEVPRRLSRWETWRAKLWPSQPRLYAPREMKIAINRELARADRLRRELSIVLFSLVRPDDVPADCTKLAGVVAKRARSTDDVGWLDNRWVCVLLPETSAEGAKQFGDHVVELAAAMDVKPMCLRQTYPYDWFDNAGDVRKILKDVVGSYGESSTGLSMKEVIADVKRASRALRALQAFRIKSMPLWKRSMDIVAAMFALILMSPVLIAAAVAIKLTSVGPVIFCQRRAGLGGRAFTIYKFRTMSVDAEAQKQTLLEQSEQDGPAFKIERDPRITSIGRLLRKSSIDELPQLLNILKGDMSLVGPRPLPIEEAAECDRWQQRRLDVTPGLTCIWQVHGRSRVSFSDWVRMDLTYIRNRTFGQDVKLLAQTIPAVLLGRGAR